MVALHATEAPAVHLTLAARVDRLNVADFDRALYQTRTLVKQLASPPRSSRSPETSTPNTTIPGDRNLCA